MPEPRSHTPVCALTAKPSLSLQALPQSAGWGLLHQLLPILGSSLSPPLPSCSVPCPLLLLSSLSLNLLCSYFHSPFTFQIDLLRLDFLVCKMRAYLLWRVSCEMVYGPLQGFQYHHLFIIILTSNKPSNPAPAACDRAIPTPLLKPGRSHAILKVISVCLISNIENPYFRATPSPCAGHSEESGDHNIRVLCETFLSVVCPSSPNQGEQ